MREDSKKKIVLDSSKSQVETNVGRQIDTMKLAQGLTQKGFMKAQVSIKNLEGLHEGPHFM